MTIDINGDVIDEITIDGQRVSEVTVDGEIVFAPLSIPDSAVFQLDAYSLNLNDGNTVETWPDTIGNNDANRDNGSPTYIESGFNNNPTVDMSTGDSRFTFNEFLSDLNVSSVEMAAVIEIRNDQNTRTDGFLHYSGDASNEHLTWDNGSYFSEMFRDTRFQIGAPSNLTTGSKFVWNVSSVDGGSWKSYFNNSEDFSTTSGNFALTPQGPILGAKRNNEYTGFGHVSELVIYKEELSSSDRQNEYERFERRWGPFDTI